VLLLGHRGASLDAPENTLEAFLLAHAQGADGVELDVQLCSTGEVVVCHDYFLDRLAGLPWEVAKTSWRRLRQLDVGTPLGFAPARIPLLAEVLDALPRHLLVNVELKSEHLDDGGLTARTLSVIREANAEARTVVSSFNPLCLFRLAAWAPKLRRGLLLNPEGSILVSGHFLLPLLSPYSVHPYFLDCTPGRMRTWREGGYAVAVWTVDDPEEARRLSSLGATHLITNAPGKLREALRSPGRA
jgi:glycerophosphoryl diester phosphodiesterase